MLVAISKKEKPLKHQRRLGLGNRMTDFKHKMTQTKVLQYGGTKMTSWYFEYTKITFWTLFLA